MCREARAPLILAPSIKAALDRDWSDPVQKAAAVKSLVIELESEHDLDLREQIARGVFTASPEFLDRADAWLQRLAGAARALPDGGASALVHEAAFRWARVCRRMRKLGLHALRRFRQSPLHGAAPASTKVQVALGALAGALAPRIAARRRSDVPR